MYKSIIYPKYTYVGIIDTKVSMMEKECLSCLLKICNTSQPYFLVIIVYQ
jgi:hypothetical protein